MHCPFCQHQDTKVIDSRASEDGAMIRRRRECAQCGERFNTTETAEVKLPTVVKGDGRREPFDSEKIRAGVRKACEKRPIAASVQDKLVEDITREVYNTLEQEIKSDTKKQMH